MSTEVKVPQLPESVSEATLAEWHKKPGDTVERDENIVDLETDKVVLEVPSPVDGVLKEIKADDGATVSGGDLIAIIDDAAAATASTTSDKTEHAFSEASKPDAGDNAAKLSPAVRRLVEEHRLDPSDIKGTGRDGRLIKSDVVDYIDQRKAGGAASSTATASPGTASNRSDSLQSAAGAREERRIPMTRLRARIAERLVQSQQNSALLTTFNEVDLTEVIELRKTYKKKFEETHGVRLGFQSFFVKASIEALKQFPAVNASIDGKELVYHDYWDIGIAVSTERGLMVPVLRDADQMSYAEVEKSVRDYAVRARDGKLGLDEITGGTFTITNGGVFGSLLSTPIINPPQSAILGMHKIQQRPVAIDGEVVVRPMMYLALTYDHRLIDGRQSVQFLVALKEALEDPARLLLQV